MSVARWAAAAAVASLGAWALAPLRPTSVETEPPALKTNPEPPMAVASLDVDAFRAPLWVAPPAPPAPPLPPAPPPPLRLQLVAVVHDAGTYRAMLYDPDEDRIVMVAAGDTVGSRRVETVTAGGVRIRDAAAVRVLALKQDDGGPP